MSGTEIRPTAVSSQIAQKGSYLEQAKGKVSNLKSAVYLFIDEQGLQSEGFSSAKAQLDLYPKLFAGIEESINLIKDADTTVDSSLSSFEGRSKVSELEWKLLKTAAEANKVAATAELAILEQQASSLRGHTNRCTTCSNARNALATIQDQIDEADYWLNLINTYRNETSGLHSQAIDDMNIAIAKGISSVFNAAHGRGMWPASDDGWFADIQEASARCRPAISNGSDIYNGTLNEDLARTLFGVPFELLSPRERQALLYAYNKMWNNRDTAAIEMFLYCAYEEGEEGEYRMDRSGHYDSRYELILTDTFKQFAIYYSETCAEGEIDSLGRDQLALRGGFLLDIALGMDSIWLRETDTIPPITVSYLTYDNFEGRSGDSLFILTAKAMTQDGDRGFDQRALRVASGGGDPVAFLAEMENADYKTLSEYIQASSQSDQSDFALDTALSALDIFCVASTSASASALSYVGAALGPAIAINSFAVAQHRASMQQSMLEDIHDISEMKNVMSYTWVNGTASIVNNEIVIHPTNIDIGDENSGLTKHINAYNASDRGKDVSVDEVLQFMRGTDHSYDKENSGMYAFLTSKEPGA